MHGDSCFCSFLCDCRHLPGLLWLLLPAGLSTKSLNSMGALDSVNRAGNDWKRGLSGRVKWVSLEPSPEEVAELDRHYPEVVELPEDEAKRETDDLLSRGLVARNLRWRVQAEATACMFWLHARLKGDIVAYNLEQEFLLFQFQEAGERDSVLSRPWIVTGQALEVEPWQPRFYPSPTLIRIALVWIRLPQLPVELGGQWCSRVSLAWLETKLVAVDSAQWNRGRSDL